MFLSTILLYAAELAHSEDSVYFNESEANAESQIPRQTFRQTLGLNAL